MAKPRTRIPEKVRAALQKEIGSVCPICSNIDVGHFQIHHIDDNPTNNDHENLLMLCAICHSKITKGDISSVEALGIKRTLVSMQKLRQQSSSSQTNNFHAGVSQSVIGHGNTVTFNTAKKTPKAKYPPGCIGYNPVRANYISYLITRYHQFKEWEIGKESMRYGLFPSQLKKQFKIGKQRTIYNLPDSRFEEVVQFIQQKLAGTKLARTKSGKQDEFFQPFQAYATEQGLSDRGDR